MLETSCLCSAGSSPQNQGGGWWQAAAAQWGSRCPPPPPRAHKAVGCPFGVTWRVRWGDIWSAVSIFCWDVVDFLLRGCIPVLEAALKLRFPTSPGIFQGFSHLP